MAGYEHPSKKDLAAHDMRVALVACRAALQAELTQRGDNDATYEFPAQPAVDAANAALARAQTAFNFPAIGGCQSGPPRFIIQSRRPLNSELARRLQELWGDALMQSRPVVLDPGVDVYQWTGSCYEPLNADARAPAVVENDSLSEWLGGVFDRIDRFFGRKRGAV